MENIKGLEFKFERVTCTAVIVFVSTAKEDLLRNIYSSHIKLYII